MNRPEPPLPPPDHENKGAPPPRRATARELPAEAKRLLDKLPVSMLCEYLGARLGQTVGERELRIELTDGRYDRGTAGEIGTSFGKLRV